jgi:hypothetical protein
MKNLAALTAGIALTAGLAACSSSSTSTAPATTAQKSGTEVIYGKLTGSAAMANNPTFHLTFTGPVATTGMIPLGGSPKKGATHTFTTAAGDLAVTLGSAGKNTGGLKSTKTCLIVFTTTVPFTVDGAKSTGTFAGATGAGHAVVLFSGDLPKLSNGKCNPSHSAAPSGKTAVATFTARTTLTVKH